ncbi:hypothetical protein ACPPVO_31385 [Dactylosporangium sp. McL0621]|uniref:hypothetical protein n=1 Tax=Dactylosporangium sp. McL0621 TaxID=3415678 RepID=UPI003CE81FE8
MTARFAAVYCDGWGRRAVHGRSGYDTTGAVACFVADMLLFTPAGDDDEDD